LFTVLGEFVLPGGGTAWTSAVIDVLGRLDVEEKAARQALMRTAADGWLAAERIGRRTRWRLTPAAEELLVEGTARIYGFTGSSFDWDGRWLLALARVPEADRRTRHRLQTRLRWAGFGNAAPGVWISTHTERADEVERVLVEAGVRADSHVFTAQHLNGSPIASLVDQAWNLAEIDAEYRDFVEASFAAGARDPIARLTDLVHSWRRFPWIDPTLPVELLPRRWSGTRAAMLFARHHASWSAAATDEWNALNE
jgi:phenylacetic acid degradation operon negative regulatory protein